MNYLKGKTVYLCGPIHAVNDDGIGWREKITPTLRKFGIHVLNPCAKTIADEQAVGEVGKDKKEFRKLIMSEDWKTIKEKFWKIVRYDLRCCDKCDFMIIEYDPTVPMVGSIHEMVVATFEKKPILLKYDKSQLDKFNPWIATFIKQHHFFADWDDMFKYLGHVNKGELDTSLWVL